MLQHCSLQQHSSSAAARMMSGRIASSSSCTTTAAQPAASATTSAARQQHGRPPTGCAFCGLRGVQLLPGGLKSRRVAQSALLVHVSALGPLSELSPELGQFASQLVGDPGSALSLLQGVVALESLPGPLRQFVSDLAAVTALSPTLPGVGRLALVWYTFFGRPAPIMGFLDYYVTGPLAAAATKKWTVENFTLRERMGGGNFGQVFEGLRTVSGDERTQSSKQLTDEQKRRRVVLKRVNLDNTEIRTNFLKAGTIAKGAAETGVVEAYMCGKVRLHPQVQRHVANFLGTFTAERSIGGFTRGTQWLVWDFESDCTLADACNGAIGSFPEALGPIFLGSRSGGTKDSAKRDALVVKAIFKKVLQGLAALHSIGIVHRDLKAENLLVTVEGRVLFIDFGAAVDMCTGVNFNPLYGMLDPRYSPPEDLVMPKTFPRAPPALLATGLAPLAWTIGRPDLFDTYSAGVLLMQLAVPQLRSTSAQKNFNSDLSNYDYDLDLWRKLSPKARLCDFTLLDRNGGAGFDLARRLLCERNSLRRGRLGTAQALRHRYFFPEF